MDDNFQWREEAKEEKVQEEVYLKRRKWQPLQGWGGNGDNTAGWGGRRHDEEEANDEGRESCVKEREHDKRESKKELISDNYQEMTG